MKVLKAIDQLPFQHDIVISYVIGIVFRNGCRLPSFATSPQGHEQ